MRKRPITPAEREHLLYVKTKRCIINDKDCKGPTEAHHIDIKMGQAKDHAKVIPLCQSHHKCGVYGLGFHDTGRKTWQARYGTEYELLAIFEKG